MASVKPQHVRRHHGESSESALDEVVVEEPLEIRVSGETLATTMRTPGHDRELAVGFLLAEGVFAGRDDIAAVAHCGRTGDESRRNVIEVTPSPGFAWVHPAERSTRRGTITTSACGVCGRISVDDLMERCTPVGPSEPLRPTAIRRALASLSEHQPIFARTGGCHMAALFTADGEFLLGHEDVGRHNAVDKVVGAYVLQGGVRAALASAFLVVSGRTSFEIVQKAVAAGIGAVVGVSAPSSLAIDVAVRGGVTLVGFARGERCVVYAGALADDDLAAAE